MKRLAALILALSLAGIAVGMFVSAPVVRAEADVL